MRVRLADVLNPDELNDTDEKILEVLADGRATPTLVRRELRDRGAEFTRQYITNRIKRLAEHGHLENVHDTGVYEISDDPREGE